MLLARAALGALVDKYTANKATKFFGNHRTYAVRRAPGHLLQRRYYDNVITVCQPCPLDLKDAISLSFV